MVHADRAIVWQDRRTAGMCRRLADSGAAQVFRDKTGLLLDAYFSGTKITWLLDHVDGLRKRAETGEIMVGTIDSWLVYKLTGGGDQQAALFAQACFEPGQAKNTYGTGSFVLENTGSEPRLGAQNLIATVACGIAQVTGGFCGAALVYAVYEPAINWFDAANHMTRPHSISTFSIFATFPASYFHGSWAGPFVDQVVGTGILVALIAALIDRRNQAPQGNMSALLIGLVVAAIGVSFGVNAGYAINPARDLGPRLFAYALGWNHLAFPGNFAPFANYWWIPIAGPLAGAIAGILLYDFFIGQVLAAREESVSPRPEPGRIPQQAGRPR